MANDCGRRYVKKVEFFLKKKDEQYEVLLNFLNNLKKTNVHTKSIDMILRMDNAGENINFQKILRNNDLDIEVEFTPVDGPEYNGVVERGFATLYGRVRASLNGAGFFGKNRHQYWAECASTANDMDDILEY